MTTKTTATRGVATLTLGSIVAAGLAALAQFVLAIWLSPDEFGQWAAALSATAFLVGVANFGEVNGFLSGRSESLARSMRIATLLNLGLVAGVFLIAGFYWTAGRHDVALLCVVLGFTVPVQGRNGLLHAAAIDSGLYGRAVAAQLVGAAVRLAIGVAVAAASSSAIALAVAQLGATVAMNLVLSGVQRRATLSGPAPARDVVVRTTARERAAWAVNSLLVTIPLQIGYFVAQFVAAPAIVGLYYLANQIALAVSGTVSGPVAKVVLSVLSKSPAGVREAIAFRFGSLLGSGMAVVVGIGGTAALYGTDRVPEEWSQVVPGAIILMASLPARMTTPVVDSYLQSVGRWWRSSAFNFVDAIGTAICALMLLFVDFMAFAIILSAWKASFALARSSIALGEIPVGLRAAVAIGFEMSFILTVVGTVVGPGAGTLLIGAGVVVASCLVVGLLRRAPEDLGMSRTGSRS
ncbi:lipopolysaccharide biosynthesis protein [Nocardioides sp. zg-DK7169]|uniref:lipopolysaccharide biosynthesis protein n=1 Tax=Nocardioides sp. zg-DK7169 TaxID=2736600 RepID=UPI001552F971|nr:oligosaccharide flippase family protein [Nocardioides sp. zg-DK7169]NPC97274.1 oligosaccharide flippase family protein [Nocardioides sp. zg-DK7169]